jgi:hypothetical protein
MVLGSAESVVAAALAGRIASRDQIGGTDWRVLGVAEVVNRVAEGTLRLCRQRQTKDYLLRVVVARCAFRVSAQSLRPVDAGRADQGAEVGPEPK